MLQDEIIKEITQKEPTQALETIRDALGDTMDKINLETLIPYSDKITNKLDASHSYLRQAIKHIKNGK